MDSLSHHARLRERIRGRMPTLGLFVRTPASCIVELLGNTKLDLIALDAEHAPFDVQALDNCILAARCAGIPLLVRLAGADPASILRVLDLGAAGIIVPHVRTVQDAQQAVAASRYSGRRGFSTSHRAGGYGAIPPAEYRKSSDEATIVIGQAEDAEAVENIDAIAAVDGLDAVFIGPADLTFSLGAARPEEPAVEQAIERICAACRRAGRTVGIYQADAGGLESKRSKGISLFIISTDQALLGAAARRLVDEFGATGR